MHSSWLGGWGTAWSVPGCLNQRRSNWFLCSLVTLCLEQTNGVAVLRGTLWPNFSCVRAPIRVLAKVDQPKPMKAHETMIVWGGRDDPAPFAGNIMVCRARTRGSGYGGFIRQMQSATDVRGLFGQFHYLVVEERIDPELLHKALMAIDEYAELFGTPHNGE